MTVRHCVVLAGGLGTRIREVTEGRIPKVLVPVLGQPFLRYKLEGLRQMGITDVTVLVGELGHMIDEFLETDPVPGLKCVSVHDGPRLLGTAGAIARVRELLPDSFWVTYGDSHVVADLATAESTARRVGAEAVMVLLHNRDLLETSNTSVQGDFVAEYRKGAPSGSFEWIDYGLLYLPNSAFSLIPPEVSTDLHTVLSELIGRGRVLAFEAQERFWDVGTPEALKATEEEFARRSGK